ncbi:MAG: hypothetical protein KatS3mg058_0839 [Roseiflexus sp.]|nr:MAG: hypothetical protein KatS3mg058_0839 [Roseiflexus sp.]
MSPTFEMTVAGVDIRAPAPLVMRFRVIRTPFALLARPCTQSSRP